MTSPAPNPLQRIRIIEGSLRCFTLSWFSLVPLFGIAFALLTLHAYSTTRTCCKHEWNPARRYLTAGFLIACAGIVFWLGTVGLGGLVLLRSFEVL